MHTNAGEMLYSISAILRFLQSLIVPSALFSYLVGSSDLNLARD